MGGFLPQRGFENSPVATAVYWSSTGRIGGFLLDVAQDTPLVLTRCLSHVAGKSCCPTVVLVLVLVLVWLSKKCRRTVGWDGHHAADGASVPKL